MPDQSHMISLTVADRIATLTLRRAPVNAICTEWIEQFNNHLNQLDTRPDWTVLWLRSDQKVFCAGADLHQVRSRIDSTDGPNAMYAYVAAI
jgi:enoyl-CoA hydratase